MFSIRLQESLLGEANRVRVVDNQWSSVVTIAGSESVLVRSLDHERRVSANRRYHTFRKIGPSPHQVVSETLLPVRYNFVFPLDYYCFCITYSPQKAKKIYIPPHIPCPITSLCCAISFLFRVVEFVS